MGLRGEKYCYATARVLIVLSVSALDDMPVTPSRADVHLRRRGRRGAPDMS